MIETISINGSDPREFCDICNKEKKSCPCESHGTSDCNECRCETPILEDIK